MTDRIRRGDIYYAALSPAVGSEQDGTRPVLVVSNDISNHHAPIVIVAPITTGVRHRLPVHVPVDGEPGMRPGSIVLCEQLRTIDKSRLRGYKGHMSESAMWDVDRALRLSLWV